VAAAAVAKAPVPEEKPKRVKPLTSWEERDWQEIPGKIQALETEMEQVSLAIADAGFYQQAEALRRPILKRADEIPAALEKLYARWESLDQRANPK
jgi:ATP-binding cassette subfamily F protein uup